MDNQPIMAAQHIVKRYGAVTALRDVSVHLNQGEILGLVGDNGAGKSTLIKILTGYIQPDAGQLTIDGQDVKLRSVSHARTLGIETVYQDLALVNQLSVYHNMFLNREQVRRIPFPILDNIRMRKEARRYLQDVGINIPSVDVAVANLSGGQRQAIAIARALYSKPKVLLLDEPLAAMGVKESGIILKLLADLKQRGDVSIIMILHNFLHVYQTCDRVNLLQHGTITFDKNTAESTVDELTNLVAVEYLAARQSA